LTGAGFAGFTRGLISDTLSVPELQNFTVAFWDVNTRSEDIIFQSLTTGCNSKMNGIR
jgi:alpha-galactosidase/6-phospho-beta-glucosidase family protein